MDERKAALKRRTKAFASVEPIWSEADELIAIFITMSLNTKTRLRKET